MVKRRHSVRLIAAMSAAAIAALAGCDDGPPKERYVKKRISTCEALLEEYVVETGDRRYDNITLSREKQNNIYRMCVKREPGFSVVWYGWREKDAPTE